MPVTFEEMQGPDPLHQALQSEGITIEYLVQKLREELNATEVKVFFNPKTGKFRYSKPNIAWKIRQCAREDAQRLLNLYPQETPESPHPDMSGYIAALTGTASEVVGRRRRRR